MYSLNADGRDYAVKKLYTFRFSKLIRGETVPGREQETIALTMKRHAIDMI